MKTSFLYDWKFWLGICIIILLVFLILCNIRRYKEQGWLNVNKESVVYPSYRNDNKDLDQQITLHQVAPVANQLEQPNIIYSTTSHTSESTVPLVSHHSTIQPNTSSLPQNSVIQSIIPPALQNPYIPLEPQPTVKNPSQSNSFFHILSSRESTPDISRIGRSASIVDITPQLPPGFIPSAERPDDSRDSRGERECRRVLEKIFNTRFDKVTPKIARSNEFFHWLKNDRTDSFMELDGFSAIAASRYGYKYRGIAFEYNGDFHYKSDHYFNKTFQDFLERAYRDERKITLCDSYGIYLFTIPYHVRIPDIEAYIMYYLPENVLERRYSGQSK